MNEFFNTILQRKSVRTFTEQTVTREQLELLARAGMAAPSAVNKQPWEFILLDDPQTLCDLGELLPYAKMVKKAQAAIVVCGNMRKSLPDWEQEFWIQDCSAATQNILLTAEALGLGAVWTGVYPAKERIRVLSQQLGLPEHIVPLNLIPIGYPAGNPQPSDKFTPENIHWNHWEK